jgi:hypothetical protein
MPSAFAQANRRLAADVSPVRGKVEVKKEVRSYGECSQKRTQKATT